MTANRTPARRTVLRSLGATAAAALAGCGDLVGRGGGSTGEGVKVNQVGYPIDAPKVGVVAVEASAFAVRDAETDEVVYTGELSAPIDDGESGETVRRADFTDASEPGEYVLETGDGGARSHPFAVGDDVFAEPLATIGRLYALKRSNTAIDDPVTGLDVEAGHTQDAEARMYFADAYHDEGETVDVAGGWYDAGDYGKYVPPAAITVGQVLLAYELYPDSFEAGQFDVPEGLSATDREAGMADLLVEAKFELEWLETMQRPDGAVYHKVAGLEWPAIDDRPAEDTQQRYVFGLSTFGTAMYAGAMAMAARIYGEHDPAFAGRALENARSAHAYLEDNPQPEFRHDGGQDDGSGAYRKTTDREERAWAAAELLKTTGEARYDEQVRETMSDQLGLHARPAAWNDALLLGQWAYYTSDAGAEVRKAEIRESILTFADDLLAHVESDGYRNALAPEEYVWASSKIAVAKGNVALHANEIEPNEAYVEAALDQLHYVLGRTATGYGYVTGLGEQPPRNPHDRLVQSTGTYVPGMLVGGPNAVGDDPALGAYIDEEDPAPAKAYLDDVESWASNEWAIDYTAPVVFALAAVRSEVAGG